ncbi:MAG: ATP-binding protein [Candidatus Limnocylindria bacterium]
MGRRDLPSGTVTFLFTDVEGSTRLLSEIGEAAYAQALAGHRRILRDVIARHGGLEVDTEGDAIFAAFATPLGALSAARDGQAGLEATPVRVRMGLHTGTPLRTEEGYVGIDVHRAARISGAGHGGQVLVSSTTAALLSGSAGAPALSDLGEHRLKDLAAPERIHQLGTDTHPPLKTLSPTNLPEPAGRLVGRSEELLQIGELLRDPDVRLVSLIGPGGIGKTRLAIEAAAAGAGQFPDGRWWVPLASVRDPAAAVRLIVQVLGLAEEGDPAQIRRHLEARQALLVVDSVEHLLPGIAARLAELLPAHGSSALVTSREPLRLRAERLVRVPVLSESAAEQLLVGRAAALGIELMPSEALTELVRRLDRLPLALELAAGRLPILSVEQVLARLGQRLDLFVAAGDADPRQRTLRTTIEWSHELLAEPEQVLFRWLAVFEGGCTLEAAEVVCEADLDVVQSLVDRSLVQRVAEADRPPRFTMLESIAQFAAERLTESGEAPDIRARHAAWARDLAERVDQQLAAGEPEERWVALLNPELDNLRAAVEFGLETDDAQLVRRIAAALPTFWVMHGRSAEGRAWIERALALDPTEDATRRRLLTGLAILAYLQGDYPAATIAADEAAQLAMRLGPAVGRYAQIREQARAALLRGDLAAAEPLLEEAFVVAREDDNGVGMSSCRINLAAIANRTARHERALALLAENLPFVRGRGQARCEANSLVGLAETFGYLGQASDAVDHAIAAAEVAPRAADPLLVVENLRWYARAAPSIGLAAESARILGACQHAEAELDAALEPHEQAARDELVATLRRLMPETGLERELARGRSLDLAAATDLVLATAPAASAP